LAGDVVIAGVAGEIEKSPVNDHDGPQFQGYGVGTKYAITHGAIADFCILGEPTNMMLIPRHCGSTWVKITVPGHLIHTAWSEVERNAINRARKVLDAIHDWIPEYIAGATALANSVPRVNTAAIEGGWSWRGARTPDNCVIYMDVRTLPDALPLQAYNEVRELVAKVVAEYPYLEGTRVEPYMTVPGHIDPGRSRIRSAHRARAYRPTGQCAAIRRRDLDERCRTHEPLRHTDRSTTVRRGAFAAGGAGFSTHQGEAVHIGDMLDIIRVYVRCILEICGVVA
jgi:acetylornithine deacetylase/succinyl-diaminopimelate desuccinylase-like protein